jgi:precorrin-6A synthase
VQVEDPQRDAQATDYVGAVHDWHVRRAALYARLIEDEIGADGRRLPAVGRASAL